MKKLTLQTAMKNLDIPDEEIKQAFESNKIQDTFINIFFKDKTIRSFNDVSIYDYQFLGQPSYLTKTAIKNGAMDKRIYFVFDYRDNPNYGFISFFRRAMSKVTTYKYYNSNFADYFNYTPKEEIFTNEKYFTKVAPKGQKEGYSHYMNIEDMNKYVDEILKVPYSSNNRYINKKDVVFSSLSIDIYEDSKQINIQDRTIGYGSRPSLLIISKVKDGIYIVEEVDFSTSTIRPYCKVENFLYDYNNWTLFEDTVFNYIDLSPRVTRNVNLNGEPVKLDDMGLFDIAKKHYPLMSKRIPDDLMEELKIQVMLDKI